MLVQFIENLDSELKGASASDPLPVTYVVGSWYTNVDKTAAAGTAQLLASGSETTTFAVNVKDIVITHTDKACYIAKTLASAASASNGGVDGRIFYSRRCDGYGSAVEWVERLFC